MTAQRVKPDNLSIFAPQGEKIYGFQHGGNTNPFKEAPRTSGYGGIIYFENSISQEDCSALLRITGIEGAKKDFKIFTKESKSPGEDSYLSQMRIVSDFGMESLFGENVNEKETSPETIEESMWSFINSQRKRWGIHFWQDIETGLAGMFGGDGDMMREELSFGLIIENDYYGIFRLWSRAFLVTK